MKRKYSLLKILLVVSVFVSAGLIYSCTREKDGMQSDSIIIYESVSEETDAEDDMEMPDSESFAETYAMQICVHICGAVKAPGVYFLSEGARVFEVVEMAGGLLDEAAEEYVNLADHVSDGLQVYIPFEGEDLPAMKEQQDGLVNINTAGSGELMTLPGIGQTKAEAIISYREQNGPFLVPEDIKNVAGIKDNTFEKIKEYIKVQ